MSNIESVKQEIDKIFTSHLSQYNSFMKESIQPFIELKVVSEETKPWNSKIGGTPYLPKNIQYPTNSEGDFLLMVAQVNFEEMPRIENFPNEGILQFFINPISKEDTYLGLNFDNPTLQEDYRVIFHETVVKEENQLISDFSFISRDLIDNHVVQGTAKLVGVLNLKPSGLMNYESNHLIKDTDHFDELLELSSMGEADILISEGHKIGGYPYFTQYDPRTENTEFGILLLQIDENYSKDLEVRWGSSGVANLFINENDLIHRDFSKVLYHWDNF